MIEPHRKIEIALCDECIGSGYIITINTKDPQGAGVKMPCYRCAGSGRLRVTTRIEVEPYE